MAWIESHQEMERDEKTLSLMLSVKRDIDWAIGFMHRFWWWALDAAPDGVVTFLCKPGMLGAAFGYETEFGDRVMAGMIAAGWLDRSPEGEVTIHNHAKYRGRLIEAREDARIRQQRRRNRVRGRGEGDADEGGENKPQDGHADVTDMSRDGHGDVTDGHAKVTTTQQYNTGHNPTQQNNALSPEALPENKQKALKGGVGENAEPPADSRGPPGFSNSLNQGLRAQGFAPLEKELPCGGFSEKDVYDAFYKLFAVHGLYALGDFFNKVKRCKTTPAVWAMVYLDKIHHVYRPDASGKTVLDYGDADPVAMTVSGLTGTPRHTPTESARHLFAEIMRDQARAARGERVKWNGNLSGPAVALELGRRKGKKGKR